jgi:hypothetical protein
MTETTPRDAGQHRCADEELCEECGRCEECCVCAPMRAGTYDTGEWDRWLARRN